MKFFVLFSLLTFSVVLCSASQESSHYSRYESACPGNVNDDTKTFGSFVADIFENNGTILTECKPEYFSNINSITCEDEHSRCVVSALTHLLCLEGCSGVYVESLPLEIAVQRRSE